MINLECKININKKIYNEIIKQHKPLEIIFSPTRRKIFFIACYASKDVDGNRIINPLTNISKIDISIKDLYNNRFYEKITDRDTNLKQTALYFSRLLIDIKHEKG